MASLGAAAAWLPTALVLLLSVLALAQAARAPAGAGARRARIVGIAVVGTLTVAAVLWQARNASDETARLAEKIHAAYLQQRIEALETQLKGLKETTKARTIGADTAAKLADFLRASGSYRVIVSCAPNDVEAFRYATQIANVLKSANWDARGPEATTIFGDVRAMAINVYDTGGRGSQAVRILLDGFAKFDIPYQSRVPPSEALPESDTVELYVSAKPVAPAAAEPAERAR